MQKEQTKRKRETVRRKERMVWYAITEFIWGSTETAPKTRAKTKLEEGWILVDTDKVPKGVSSDLLLVLSDYIYFQKLQRRISCRR